MKTYQDFEAATDKLDFIRTAINEYRTSEEYKTALIADEYERQQNTTIMQYTKYLYTETGRQIVDAYSANHHICSNFFHRLNTDRASYSLGNGISFPAQEGEADTIKPKLGPTFDTELYRAAYAALIHGTSYSFWNLDKLHVFPATEFCPLWDEYDGTLRAGIRFWSLDWQNKPVTAVLYEEDGFTAYRTKKGSKGLDLAEYEPKKAYVQRVAVNDVDGVEVIGESNYGSLPIVPLRGNKNKQSTLVGMRAKIDSYDLIRSGFANDLTDCAEIYWLITNGMAMSQETDLSEFRERLKLQHIAKADGGESVTPYTQEIPTQAREAFLSGIRAQIYEDFGGLDVHTIAAGATNDHIDAAYQPVDEEADDFEYQIIQFVQQILALQGLEGVPQFKRNRISNQYEQTQMVMMTADHLDEETLLNKLPFITVDEVRKILENKDAEAVSGVSTMENLQAAIDSGNE